MPYDKPANLRIEPAERVIMQAASSAARERYSTAPEWDAKVQEQYARRGLGSRLTTVWK